MCLDFITPSSANKKNTSVTRIMVENAGRLIRLLILATANSVILYDDIFELNHLIDDTYCPELDHR